MSTAAVLISNPPDAPKRGGSCFVCEDRRLIRSMCETPSHSVEALPRILAVYYAAELISK